MRALVLTLLGASLLLPQASHAGGMVPLQSFAGSRVAVAARPALGTLRSPVFDRFHRFAGFGFPGIVGGVAPFYGYGYGYGDAFAGSVAPGSSGTPVVVVVGSNALPAACRPPERHEKTVETTPSGVTVVRGPWTSAAVC